MLVLTRRVDETLMVGDHVTLTVLKVNGDRVRFGVNAPREIRVQRAPKTQRASETAENGPPLAGEGAGIAVASPLVNR